MRLKMTVQFDLLIKNGLLIDGTGNPYYKADIAMAAEKIIRIDRNINPTGAQRIINADSLIVAPGFFDTHSHDDLYLLINPTCDEKILQGVTTTVIGNCGFSPVPISDDYKADIKDALRLMGGEHIPKEDLEFQSFDNFLRKIEALKPGINVIPLVGHSTVRIAVIGSANRAPTDSELKKMKELVAIAMEEGAFGMSTGLIYAPGNYAKTDEIIELAKVISKFNGIYASHIRSEGDQVIPAIGEAIEIGEEAGIPLPAAEPHSPLYSNYPTGCRQGQAKIITPFPHLASLCRERFVRMEANVAVESQMEAILGNHAIHSLPL